MKKQILIIPILAKLRTFNPNIGIYEKSVLHENLNYIVKLSNGKIEMDDTLISDFEKNHESITESRYKAAAKKFVALEQTMKNEKVNKITWLIYFLLTIAILLFIKLFV